MTDIKRDLLIFLYEQRHSMRHVSINHIFKDCGYAPLQIKNLLKDLKKNEIIQITNDFMHLGSSPPPHGGTRYWITTEHIQLTAMLTHIKGEQFVREHYLKAEHPTINAGQVVYSHGDINAPVNQSDNHSFLDNLQIKTPKKTPKKTDIKIRRSTLSSIVNAIWNNIILVVIATLIGGYIIYRLGWNGQYTGSSKANTEKVNKTIKK